MREFIRRILAKYRRPYWRVVYVLGGRFFVVDATTHGGCPTTGLLNSLDAARNLLMYCDMMGRSPVPSQLVRIDYNHPLVSLSHYRSKNA